VASFELVASMVRGDRAVLEKMLREKGAEPVGTCPRCKAENPDTLVKMMRDAGITTLSDMGEDA
jgi:hypothetical protein